MLLDAIGNAWEERNGVNSKAAEYSKFAKASIWGFRECSYEASLIIKLNEKNREK